MSQVGPTLALDWNDEAPDAVEENALSNNIWGTLVALNPSYQSVEISENEIILGRQSTCHVSFHDRNVSGRHCKVYKDDKGIFLQDLSSNGTYLNGEKIGNGNCALLQNGNEVTIKKKSEQDPGIIFIFKLRANQSASSGEAKAVEDKYDIREVLGTGNFAAVKLAIHKKTGKKYAMKVIDKKKYLKNAASRKDALMDEVNILKSVSHPSIIGIEEVFDTEKTLYIVLELVTGGEMFDYVAEHGGIEEKKVVPMFKQLIEAVHYLHSRGIVHRDLKPENILFSDKKYDSVKISDFGLSRIVGDGAALQTMCGTPAYLAPEVITNSESKGYSNKVDVWSLGAILFFLIAGQPPFDDSKPMSLFDQVKAGTIDWSAPVWNKASEAVKDLIKCMLNTSPEERYDCAKCLSHPWFTGSDLAKLQEERKKTEEEKRKKEEEKKNEEDQRKRMEEDERIKKEVEKRTKEIEEKIKQEAEVERNKKRKREESDEKEHKNEFIRKSSSMSSSKDKILPLCKYGESCYRKNPQHLAEFRHPPRRSSSSGSGHSTEPESDDE